MINDVYDRLTKLYLNLGIDIKNDPENEAEVYTFSKAITSAKEQINYIMSNLFFESLDSIKMYSDLLDIIVENKSYTDCVNEIKSKLGMDYSHFKKELYNQSLLENGNIKYAINNLDEIVIDRIEKKDLPLVHRFIKSWKPLIFNYSYKNEDGKTKSFDYIDNLRHDWEYIDRLKLCWEFLENYKEKV